MIHVRILAQHFYEDSVLDGDMTYHDTKDQTLPCESVETAVRVIRMHGLTFEATGSDWAADPDGSYIANYATAERVETSAHVSGATDAEMNAIMAGVDA